MSEPEVAVRVFPGPEALAQYAADVVVAAADEAVRRRQEFLFCLAGGSTPRRLYELLASAPRSARVPWASTRVFFGDERCVPPDDAASNYGMVRRALLSRVPLADDRVQRIRGELEPARAAADYESVLRTRLGVGASGAPARGFDLVLLGMGDDGHTASLFPDSTDEPDRWASARVHGDTPRVTLLPQVFNTAHAACFLVTGAPKAVRVADVLLGPHRPAALPAQRIAPAGGGLTWLLDHAAASALLERCAYPGASGRLRVEVRA